MSDVCTFVIRITDTCNFRCSYCDIPSDKNRKMNDYVLSSLIEKAIKVDKTNIIFIWHGGEPLSVGLNFYEKAVNYQKEIQRLFDSLRGSSIYRGSA